MFYSSASRKNLPTEQTEPLMGPDDKRPVPFTPEIHAFDEQPRLAWARSPRIDENGSIKPYEAHPLYTREKIEPHLFVKQLQAGGDIHQGSMFEAFNGLPEGSALDWYQYDGNWQNRLIHGESARVMASLAGRENLAGQVQMIYFDPPYGMRYKSNFQVAVDDLGTSENRQGIPRIRRRSRRSGTRTSTASTPTWTESTSGWCCAGSCWLRPARSSCRSATRTCCGWACCSTRCSARKTGSR